MAETSPPVAAAGARPAAETDEIPPILGEQLMDIRRNMELAKEELLDDPAGNHIKETLWPFMEGLAEKLDEVLRDYAGALEAAVEEEMLSDETGGEIIATMSLGGALALELRRRILEAKDNSPNGRKFLAKIDEYAAATKKLVPLIQELSVEIEDDPDAAEGDPDDDDEEDDEEDADGDDK